MVKSSSHGMRPFWGGKSLCCGHSFTYASAHTFIYSQPGGAALRRWPRRTELSISGVSCVVALKDSSGYAETGLFCPGGTGFHSSGTGVDVNSRLLPVEGMSFQGRRPARISVLTFQPISYIPLNPRRGHSCVCCSMFLYLFKTFTFILGNGQLPMLR